MLLSRDVVVVLVWLQGPAPCSRSVSRGGACVMVCSLSPSRRLDGVLVCRASLILASAGSGHQVASAAMFPSQPKRSAPSKGAHVTTEGQQKSILVTPYGGVQDIACWYDSIILYRQGIYKHTSPITITTTVDTSLHRISLPYDPPPSAATSDAKMDSNHFALAPYMSPVG